jgi:hypothetical protein
LLPFLLCGLLQLLSQVQILLKEYAHVFWQPKRPIHSDMPSSEAQETGQEGVEAPQNNISPPIHCIATENHNFNTASHISEAESPPIHTTTASPLVADHPNKDMVNFVDNPTPFVPDGLEVEDWVHPAHGRIIINNNPPRCHDEYAIVFVHPPPAN